MKQSDGTDLFGTNDPRSITIGLIDVAPDDDRQSVLAAILTQVKLGRKQVAVVLPEPNNAFQRSIDFDGLKKMQRKLKAQIVFVIPGDSDPAEFARQRRFPVHSSLQKYAQLLTTQERGEANMNRKKPSWLFGRKQQPSELTTTLIPLRDKKDSSASTTQESDTNGKKPLGLFGRKKDLSADTAPVGGKPQRGKSSGSEIAAERTRPSRRRGGVIIVLLLLLIPLLALLYGLYGARFVPASNTVTITPASADLKNTYTILAVTGTPVPSQQQVEARQLSSSAPAQSKTITATGSGQNPGVQAIGTLTFYNANAQAQTVPSGTVLTDSNGIEVITADTALIPPATPPTFGSVTVNARAVKADASGNISALDFNNVACCNIAGVTAKNTAAFAGGQDGSSYTLVQQSDIDGVATPLETSLMQMAQAALQSQVRSNEQIADHPQCTPKVTPDHQAGEKAPTVTVTVTVTCTAEAYDHQGTLSMAENLLKQEAAKNPGPGYALVGNLVTTVTQTTVTDPNKGTLSVLVKAEGVWVYQFSDAQKQALAKLIAGKKTHDAQTLLLQQLGVTKVAIQGVNDDTLPTDFRQIKLVLQSIPGVQESTTPTT